jgi:hypothetical protein
MVNGYRQSKNPPVGVAPRGRLGPEPSNVTVGAAPRGRPWSGTIERHRRGGPPWPPWFVDIEQRSRTTGTGQPQGQGNHRGLPLRDGITISAAFFAAMK